MSDQDATPTLDDDVMDALDRDDEDFDDDVDLDDEPLGLGENVLLREYDPSDGEDDADGIEAELLAGGSPMAAPSMSEERLARLEQTARVLAESERTREQGRVHRKVQAATTGAGAAGFVPILLGLVGALHLPPNLAATASAAASLVGALFAGYMTPEREQPVTSAAAVQDLLDEGVEPGGPLRHRAAHRRAHAGRRRG